jgi:predicted outer membrane protein
MINRLTNSSTTATSDRQFMRSEVMMHQHMLNELTMLQPQASGAARQLIDQTIPVVQQHLSLAQSVWRQVGGGMNNGVDSNGTSQ